MDDIRQQLREQGRQQLAAIARGNPAAPQMSADEFRVGFEQYVKSGRVVNTSIQSPTRT